MDISITDEEKEFLLNGTNLVDGEDECDEEEGMTIRLLLKGVSREDYSEIATFLDSLGVDYDEL